MQETKHSFHQEALSVGDQLENQYSEWKAWCWTANRDLSVKPSVFSSWIYTCHKAIALTGNNCQNLPKLSLTLKYKGDHCSVYVSLVSVSRKILPELFPWHVEVQLQKPPASLSAWSWLLIARDCFKLWSLKERKEEKKKEEVKEKEKTTMDLWNLRADLEISEVSCHKLLWALV